ncbi:uncharacterized protein LOC113758046 [Coffea eugenioides]|uniref:uncharacterized protein LOC113758046 n=1 Tax=Coffea eugenioides TaxID=49369 RepID=UPI000F610A6F|nr:uncharacterized protein LOC113758046 [Coffea eugenioides]
MIKLFYSLGADINLKQPFISSLPKPLTDGAELYIHNKYGSVLNLTIGQIKQAVFLSLDDLCHKRKVIREYLKGDVCLDQACKKPELITKGKCQACTPSQRRKGSRRFKRFKSFTKAYKNFPRKSFRKKWRYFRRKSKRFRGTKGNKCFICGKPGHFAKNCPQNQKGVKLISEIQNELHFSITDLESEFSEQEEPTDTTLLALQVPEDILSIGPIAMTNKEDKEEEVYPQTLIHILLDKYSKPIPLIAFFDTGAHTSIIRKDILPDSYWIPKANKFRGADGNLFETRFVTKNPITLKLLPDCCVSSKFLGANFTGKDLLLGFDLYRQNKYLITGNGIKSKKFFKPFIEIPKLYLIQDESVQQDQLQQFQKQIIQESCSTNHQEFLPKCDHPLWENSEFFIRLHFKKNEDINPTKASHSGMNPNDTKLAEQECQELLKFGLIEISHSQWACQAFYVNKRSEQVRGKMRLVINYQPLNIFLLDDKFPIPNRFTIFSQISKANWFSKFDLKSGFWQLGIHPEDRHKTGFCIPNHHFQWKVMPFGLKTAPSLFQKAMIRIFQPILHSALVYIDDILLFSNTFEEHLELLKDFHHLVKQYGIMLSEKKMFLAQQEISFLGMKITQGKCTPEQHVGQSIKDFPEDNLSKTQVQQFLGVVNYVREFLPKVYRTSESHVHNTLQT